MPASQPTVARRARLLGAVAIAFLLTSCMGDPLAPFAGVYSLRSIEGFGVRSAVPGAIPNGVQLRDSLGYISGAFALGPGRSWRLQLSSYRVVNGVRFDYPDQIATGQYKVEQRSRGKLVIDLANGMPRVALATLVTTAIVRHDSVYFGVLQFAR